jgi:precorrin-6B methylase 1
MLMKNSNLTNSNLWLSSNDNITANISSGLTNTAAANTTVSATNQLNEEMRKTANELLDSMQDSRFSETEVIKINFKNKRISQ